MSSTSQPDTVPLPADVWQHVDEACDRFEAAWKSGQRPRVEDFLSTLPEAIRAAALPELIAVEESYLRHAPGEPRRLGKFQLLERVGAGAFGEVWRAHDTELDRLVAVKVPHPGLLSAPQALERFQREARAAAQLRHPGIVPVHEVATLDGVPAIVSDFVDGVPLRDLLQTRLLTFRETATLVADVAEALDYAHGMGVVHRDVKPANVLLSGGLARLVDFGLALREGADATLTQEGQFLGTPAYASPEQAAGQGHTADQRTDVYSLGVVLYELLTGELPFRGSKESVVQQVLHEEPKPPRRVNPAVPRDLETVCLKAMAKEPGRRYATARELADDLRRWLDGEPIRARPVGVFERGLRWAWRRPAAAPLILVTARGGPAIGGVITGLVYSARLEQEIERAETFRYFHHIAVAQATWRECYLSRTLSLLEACPADRRGWEWHYLQRLCHADLFTLRGHESEVACVAFSPDGTRIASGGHDGKVCIWDAATRRLLDKLDAHSHLVNAVAFSPDGKWLASASPDGTLKVWNWKTKDEPLRLPTHKGWAQCVAFSPDGTQLAAGGAEGTVQVWTLAAPHKPLTIAGHRPGQLVIGIAFSPDGRQLASTSQDRTVILWDVHTGRKEHTLEGHTGWVHAVAFSPDGTRLVSASQDMTLRIWDPATGQPLHELEGHTAAVTSVAFSPDGSRLASTSRDQSVRIWDAATRKLVSTLRGHTGWVQRVAFSPDGSRLASVSSDGTVKVWSVLTEAECRTLKGHTDHVFAVAFSPDGGRLASVSSDDSVRIWDMTTGRAVRTLPHQVADIPSMAYSPDGSRLAAPRKDGTVIIWDAQTGEKLLTLKGHDHPIWTVAFSPDSAWLASSDVDGQVKLWDVATGREVRAFPGLPREGLGRVVPPTMGRPGVAFNPRGTALAAGGTDGRLRVWNLQTGEEIFQVRAHVRNTRCVAFSPDGNRLASGGWDEKIRIWDARTGREVQAPLQGHTGPVNTVAYSPDGNRLASAATDQTLRIWDVATGEELLILHGHRGLLAGMAFSPDGSRLATASGDNTVKIWDGNARPVSPEERVEREAVSVLDFLLARPLDKAAVREHLNTTQTIGPAVRQKALDLLEQYPEETWQAGRKE